jgi:hypothetical protein
VHHDGQQAPDKLLTLVQRQPVEPFPELRPSVAASLRETRRPVLRDPGSVRTPSASAATVSSTDSSAQAPAPESVRPAHSSAF